jgi:hypothetical protein
MDYLGLIKILIKDMIMNKIIAILLLGLVVKADDFYYEYGKKVMIVKSLDSRDNSGIKYYENSLGKKIGVTDEIIFQFIDNNSSIDILKKYNIDKIDKLSDRLYLIKAPKGQNIFELSQKLYEENSIEFAHPNFIKERKRR